VVVSDVGGLPETVHDGQTGLLCPAPDQPGALAAWTDALARVLADPQAARAMAQRGREQVLKQFDPAANLAALVRACS
jgi:glycosyltransferase involved in cell wall biosynthesis